MVHIYFILYVDYCDSKMPPTRKSETSTSNDSSHPTKAHGTHEWTGFQFLIFFFFFPHLILLFSYTQNNYHSILFMYMVCYKKTIHWIYFYFVTIDDSYRNSSRLYNRPTVWVSSPVPGSDPNLVINCIKG